MKHLLLSLLVVMAALMPASMAAYDFEVNGIYYIKRANNTLRVTYKDNNYNSYSGHVVLPPTVTYEGVTYTVTEIGNNAFMNCKELLSVDIQSPINAIYSKAFSGCSSLTNIELPKTLKTTGHTLFEKCTSLTSMTIPDSVTTVASNMFWYCTNIKSIHIGKSVSSIGNSLLLDCDSLTCITVDPENTTFDSRDNCNAIIETATNTLFLGCKTTVIPNTIETIGARAIYFVKGIKTLTIPNSVTTIKEEGLAGCDIHSLVIPNSVVTIETRAFQGCCNLEQITIGSSVTSIGESAFQSCDFIRKIFCLAIVPPVIASDTFEDSPYTYPILYVPTAGFDSYIGNYYWSRFQVQEIESQAYNFVVDGIYYKANGNNATVNTWVHNQYSGDVVIPDVVVHDGTSYNVVAIANQAFYDCYNLNSIVIGNNVKNINANAFELCTALTNVDFGDGITSIGESAFTQCVKLKSVILPASTVSIGNSAFSSCESINLLSLPENLQSIGGSAFSGCHSLTELYIPHSVSSIGISAFSKCRNLCSITVANDNTTFDSRESCNAIINTIDNTLITGCKGTIIPTSVVAIGRYAFYYCTDLTSIQIPNSILTIDDYAFNNCVSLSKVKLPDNIERIGKGAFGHIDSLKKVDIPASLTQIGDWAYTSSKNITQVISHATTPPSHSANSLFDYSTYTSALLSVPNESLEAYQSDSQWGKFTRIVPFIGAGPGDTNGDGNISIGDVTYLIDMLLESDELPAWADVNGDGRVSIGDITALIDLLLESNQ